MNRTTPWMAGALLALLMASGATSPAAATANLFYENWDATNANWSYATGASRDCSWPNYISYGCSLLVAPTGASWANAAHLMAPAIPATAVTVKFAFMGSTTDGNVDSELHILTDAAPIVFAITAGYPPHNNGMMLNGAGCGAWPAAGTWYYVSIKLDRAGGIPGLQTNGVASAEVRDGSGTLVGSCSAAYTGTFVQGLDFGAISWGWGGVYHYEDVSVQV